MASIIITKSQPANWIKQTAIHTDSQKKLRTPLMILSWWFWKLYLLDRRKQGFSVVTKGGSTVGGLEGTILFRRWTVCGCDGEIKKKEMGGGRLWNKVSSPAWWTIKVWGARDPTKGLCWSAVGEAEAWVVTAVEGLRAGNLLDEKIEGLSFCGGRFGGSRKGCWRWGQCVSFGDGSV